MFFFAEYFFVCMINQEVITCCEFSVIINWIGAPNACEYTFFNFNKIHVIFEINKIVINFLCFSLYNLIYYFIKCGGMK